MSIYLPSFILSIILTATTISIYGTLLPLQFLPLIVLICAISFSALIFTDRHRLFGSLLMTVFIVLSLGLIRILASAGMQTSDVFFWQWVLTSGDEVEYNVFFIIALLTGAGVFFSVTVYYFDVVLYRISFLTLICLMPCILYAKVMADIENFYLVLIAGGALLMHIIRAHLKKSYLTRNSYSLKELLKIPSGSFRFIVPAMFFIFFVLLFCALFPKKEEARFYDRFEDVFLGDDTTSALSNDYSSLAEYSGNADNYDGTGNRRMYTLYGDAYSYLKRQNFDYYDFKNDRWYFDKTAVALTRDPYEWKTGHEALQLNRLLEAIKTAGLSEPEFIKKYSLEKVNALSFIEDHMRSLFIRSENFGAVYYLSAPRSVQIIPGASQAPFGVTRSGVFLLQNGLHPNEHSYRLYFYDQASGLSNWLKTGAADLSYKESLMMLKELTDILTRKSLEKNDSEQKTYEELIRTADAFLNEENEAARYLVETSDNTSRISKRIKDLSLSVTKDCRGDYEKAHALVQYFHNEDFAYDLSFIPEDKSPEYFLFESKTGSCSDFATAFVLMARSAGLTVRYAEGYLPEITSRENYYTISEKDSHAFPEVFLPNTGWVVFEPTVGGNAAQTDPGSSKLLDIITSLRIDFRFAFIIGLFAAALILILAFMYIFIPLVTEGFFRICLYFYSPEKCSVKAYLRLRKKTGCLSLTPRELKERFSSLNVDISYIADIYEQLTYARNITFDVKELKYRIIREYSKAAAVRHL